MAPSLVSAPAAPIPDLPEGRILLLSPPELASHPTHLESLLAKYPKDKCDIQMLDRLAMSAVKLPNSTYARAVVLSAPGSSQPTILADGVLEKVKDALKGNGRVEFETPPQDTISLIFAGYFVENIDGRAVGIKVADEGEVVTLGKKKSKRKANKIAIVDFSDDWGNDGDEELIDENTLLDEEDMKSAVRVPDECKPKPGKKRRACANCVCGLKEELEEEDKQKRAEADKKLAEAKEKHKQGIQLDLDELAEIDFTVKGKVQSCGSCYLGDAFRCAGCPYIGLPAFKPGEQVKLSLDDDQL